MENKAHFTGCILAKKRAASYYELGEKLLNAAFYVGVLKAD
jgi:hypothetical protein